MMKVKMSNPESEPFMCNKIQVLLAYKIWEFPCSFLMSKQEKDKFMTLSVSGRTSYKVKLNVSGQSPDPVWVQF